MRLTRKEKVTLSKSLEALLKKEAAVGTRSVNVDDLILRFPLPRARVTAMLRTSDLGTYVVGRRGHLSRFVFAVKTQAPPDPTLTPFPFPLSRGVVATMYLPDEIEPNDIDRMCAYLQSFKHEEKMTEKKTKLTSEQAHQILNELSDVLEKHGVTLFVAEDSLHLETAEQIIAVKDLEDDRPIDQLPLVFEVKFVDATRRMRGT